MKKKKATNKQIIDAYGQSYRLMQKAKQHDDDVRELKSLQVRIIKNNPKNYDTYLTK